MITAIRPADKQSAAECGRLLAVWTSAVKSTHTFLPQRDFETIRAEVQQALQAVGQLYCCSVDGVVQGFVGVEDDKVEMLFVDAAARGSGIGRQLLRYAIDRLHARYVDVNEQNQQAVGFYRHMGFEMAGRSEWDNQGRPYPILHLRLSGIGSSK